ncbi:MAG: hypothetical protein FVQ81_03085 [Candidatus Glassbacteria bacterium]|nr:hypothetical protein [Candidatus Glassbacteria bacterium]
MKHGTYINLALAALLAGLIAAPLDAAAPARPKAKRIATARLARFEARQSSGNNVAFYLSNTGFLAVNPTSPFAPGGFWPSGSTNNYIYQSGLNILGVIDADGDGVYGDTVETSAVYDAEWREGRAAGSTGDPDAGLFFSSSSTDLDNWPEEFRAVDDDPDSPTFGRNVPLVIGDQDVVGFFTDVGGPVFQSAGTNRLGIEVAWRAAFISTGAERDILFVNWTITNASAYVDPAEVPGGVPYDIRAALADLKSDFDIGSPTDDASAILPTRQLALAYDSDFNEESFGRQPAINGVVILRSPTEDDGLDNPTVLEPGGNGLVDETFGEIMDAGLTHPLTGEPLTFPESVRSLPAERFFLYTMFTFGDQRPDPFSDAEAYRILSAQPGAALLPEFDPYAEFLEATIVEDLRQNIVVGPFELPAGGTGQEIWAAYFFSHAANAPALNGRRADLSKLTPAGEFSRAIALGEVARVTFEAGFLRSRPPSAPEFRLIPGDRQVTITWDDFPVHNTFDDYAGTLQAEQLTLQDSLPPSFPHIDSYREEDFEGFRVYRSLTGERGDAVMIARFDLDNNITDYTVTRTVSSGGFTGSGPLVLNLGTDTGLRFSFTDRGEDIGGLINGIPLFYTVTSYDFNPFNTGAESIESNIGFKRQDESGRFIQQVTPRSQTSSYRAGTYDNLLAAGDGTMLEATSITLAADTIGSSSDTVRTDPLDPTNRSVYRHNLVLDITSPARPQTGALAAGDVEIVYGRLLPDSGWLEIDSIEAAGPATRLFNLHYHWEDSHGYVETGSLLEKSFPYGRTERISTVHFHGLSDTAGVTYSGQVELYRGGRADAKVAPLRINGSAGTVLSPGITYPHPQYRFTALPASVGFAGTPFVVFQPMNIDQLNSEYVAGESARTTSNMASFAPGDIEISWRSDTEIDVRDLTHRVDLRFSQFTDDGWGFLPLDTHDHEDMIWQSLHVHPKTERDYRLQPNAVYAAHPEKPDSISMALYVRGVELFVTGITQRPRAGDVWLVRCEFNDPSGEHTSPVPGQRVVYRFQRATDLPEDERLQKVRVVPNPYIVSSALDGGPGDKTVLFTGLPPEASIRIYTISGVLVNVLEHGPGVAESGFSTFDSGGGTRRFDLRTRFGQEMASGTYYYHVESRRTGEEYLGKFSIIN